MLMRKKRFNSKRMPDLQENRKSHEKFVFYPINTELNPTSAPELNLLDPIVVFEAYVLLYLTQSGFIPK